MCLCWFAFLDFENKLHFFPENFALCFKTHSVVKSQCVLLYGFSIHNKFLNKIHTVYILFMHEAHPCFLQVNMVLHCVHFLNAMREIPYIWCFSIHTCTIKCRIAINRVSKQLWASNRKQTKNSFGNIVLKMWSQVYGKSAMLVHKT